MHAAYLSYYGILVAAPLGLWLAGRRAAARATLLLTMTTFYLCYTIFLAFPVAGPRYLLAPARNAATAVPVAAFTHRLLEGGSAWGTAFPSSHVAAALVAACCAWRGWRPLGMALVPLSLLLSLATVYGAAPLRRGRARRSARSRRSCSIAGRRAGYDAGAAVAKSPATRTPTTELPDDEPQPRPDASPFAPQPPPSPPRPSTGPRSAASATRASAARR